MRPIRTVVAMAVGVFAAAVGVAPAEAVSGGTALPDPAAAPWMATLAFTVDRPLPQRAYCGGTLIAPDRVLTAAHCVDGHSPSDLEVYLGAADHRTATGPALGVRGISELPGYRLIPSPKEPADLGLAAAVDDAAVVLLDRPVPGVRPVELAGSRPAAGTPVVAYGHGNTQPRTAGDILHRGRFDVMAGRDCEVRFGGVVDQASMLCAQGTTPGTTICPGDSGGPLILAQTGRPVQVGVTSFAGEVEELSCGQPSPAGFTDVARVRDWALSPSLPVAPVPEGKPVVEGQQKAGGTLACVPPVWRGRPTAVTTAWYRQNTDETGFEWYSVIDGATSETFTVPADLAGAGVLCEVTAYSAGGNTIVESEPAPIPA